MLVANGNVRHELDDTSVSKERLLSGRVQCTRYMNMQSHTRESMLPEDYFLLQDKDWGRSTQQFANSEFREVLAAS